MATTALWDPRSRRLHVILLISFSYFCSTLFVNNFGLNLTCMVVDHPKNVSSKCQKAADSAKHHTYHGTLEWSKEQEDHLLSATPWGSIAVQIPSIWIARRLSSSLLLQIVILTHVLFNVLVPVAAVHIGYAAVFVLRVLIGISHAFFAVAVYSLIDKWFPKFERSTALAVFYVGGQVAGIVGGPLTGAICASDLGWQTNFYIMSIFGAAFCILWQLFAAESPRWCKAISKNELEFLLANVHVVERNNVPVPYRKVLTSLAVLAEWLVNFACTVGLTVSQSFFPQFFKEEVMITPVMNGWFEAVPNTCSFVTRLAWSAAVDYFKKTERLSPTVAAKLSQSLCSSGVVVFFLLMGFTVGCDNPGVALAISSLISISQSLESAGHTTSLLSLAPQHTQTLSAMSLFFSQAARLTTPYAVGALRKDEVHGWQHVFIMASAVNFVGMGIFLIIGSGVEQSWAFPDKEMEEDIRGESDEGRMYAILWVSLLLLPMANTTQIRCYKGLKYFVGQDAYQDTEDCDSILGLGESYCYQFYEETAIQEVTKMGCSSVFCNAIRNTCAEAEIGKMRGKLCCCNTNHYCNRSHRIVPYVIPLMIFFLVVAEVILYFP